MAEVNHHKLEPILSIGKLGMTDFVIKKIKELLRRKKVIKIKFLSSAIKNNKKELTERLAKETNSRIVHKVGFIVVLERIK